MTPETPAAGQADPTPGAVPETPAAPKPPVDAGTPPSEPARTEGTVTDPPKAPEKYELVVPEGGRIDAEDLSTFTAIATEQGWTNEQAQAALVLHDQELGALSARFLAQTEADPTYGGAHLAETQRLARLALDRVRPAGTPQGDRLRRLLDKTGYGNHIEVLSLWADLGKLMAEDTPGHGFSGSDARPLANRLYPNQT